MPKRRIIRKSNKPLNIFVDGGDIQTPSAMDKASALSGNISAVGAGLSNMLGASMQNAQLADTSAIENSIDQAQSYVVGANNNEDLLNEWGNYSPLEGVSWTDVRGGTTGQRLGNTLGSIGSGAGAGAAIGGLPGAIIGGILGLGSAVGGWITGDTKAKKQADAYNQQIKLANAKNLASLENRAANIDTQNDLNMLANFSAYGGPINIFGSGAIDYKLAKEDLYNKQLSAMSKYKMPSMPNSFETPELAMFAKGGKIHIKKANRGKFTDYCGGKVTSECIARGKRSKSAAVRKRATFAQNARKFKHAYGGFLEGMEYDLDESIVKDLISKGYEIEYL